MVVVCAQNLTGQQMDVIRTLLENGSRRPLPCKKFPRSAIDSLRNMGLVAVPKPGVACILSKRTQILKCIAETSV